MNGKRYSRRALEIKFGDKVDDAIAKHGFQLVTDPKKSKQKEKLDDQQGLAYERNGKTFSRKALEVRFGDNVDQAIDKFGFKPVQQSTNTALASNQDYSKVHPVKKKESLPSESAQPVSASNTEDVQESTSSASERGKTANKDEEKLYNGETTGDNKKRELTIMSTSLGEHIASYPNAVYKLFAWPQNALADATGAEWLRATPEKLSEVTGVQNEILDYYEEETKKLRDETDSYYKAKYGTDENGNTNRSAIKAFSEGNISQGFELLSGTVIESTGVSLAMMAGGAAAGAAKLSLYATPAFLESSIDDLKQTDPIAFAEMTESEILVKALGMAGAETVFAAIGTGTLGQAYKEVIKREGLEAGKATFKQGLIEMYKKAFKKFGAPMSAGGEGIEEIATQVTQNLIKGRPATEGVGDAFLSGVGGGLAHGAPMNAIQATGVVKDAYAKHKINKELKNTPYNDLTEVFKKADEDEIDATQITIGGRTTTRNLLKKDLEKQVIKGDITQDEADQAMKVFDQTHAVIKAVDGIELSDSQKLKAVNLLKKRTEIEAKIEGKDPNLVKKERDEIERINKELMNIRNPEEDTEDTDETKANKKNEDDFASTEEEERAREQKQSKPELNEEDLPPNEFTAEELKDLKDNHGVTLTKNKEGQWEASHNYKDENDPKLAAAQEAVNKANKKLNERIEERNRIKKEYREELERWESENQPKAEEPAPQEEEDFEEEEFYDDDFLEDDEGDPNNEVTPKPKATNEPDELEAELEDAFKMQNQEAPTTEKPEEKTTPKKKKAEPTRDESGRMIVEKHKFGEGGTRGTFKTKDGRIFKSSQRMERNIENFGKENAKVTFTPIDSYTEEHKILQENQDLKHLPRVGKEVETTEGRAFEIETLEEIKEGELTLEEARQIDETLAELNKRGIAYSDKVSVMRRPNGEVVLTDLSNAVKVSDANKRNEAISANVVDLMKPADQSEYEATINAEWLKKRNEMFGIDKGEGYTYFLTQRPPSIGTHPTENLTKDPEETTINGTNRKVYRLTYSKPLTQEEIDRYELTKETLPANMGDMYSRPFGKDGELIKVITNVGDKVEITTFFNGEREVDEVGQRQVKRELEGFTKVENAKPKSKAKKKAKQSTTEYVEERTKELIAEKGRKEKISEIFNKVSFRKFGNAFRKHIDPNFRRDYNEKAVGGAVGKNLTWEELAGYKIGDGNYSVTQEQFENFMSEFPEEGEKRKGILNKIRDKIIETLKGTGLAKKVHILTNDQIKAKVKELGVENIFQQAQNNVTYYSNAVAAYENLNLKERYTGKRTPEQWVKALTDVQKNGGVRNVNQELEWMGFKEIAETYMEHQNLKSIDAEYVHDFIYRSAVELKEFILYENMADVPALEWRELAEGEYWQAENSEYHIQKENDTNYSIYYDGEWLLARPTFEAAQEFADKNNQRRSSAKYGDWIMRGGEKYREVLITLPFEQLGIEYNTPHFDGHENILAHLRLTERIVNGEKILFIEEVQSDWAQAGKKRGWRDQWDIVKLEDELDEIFKRSTELEAEIAPVRAELDRLKWSENEEDVNKYHEVKDKYKEKIAESNRVSAELANLNSKISQVKNKVPEMPYTNTSQWAGLTIRRAMQEAVKIGADRIAWTTGKQQGDRYNLRKAVKAIDYKHREDGTYDIYVVDHKDYLVFRENKATPERLESLVGKEITKKIVADEGKKDLERVAVDGYTKFKTGGTIEAENLEVGGEGMIAFYDKILPNIVKKEARRFDKKMKVDVINLSGVDRKELEKIADKLSELYTAKVSARIMWMYGSEGETDPAEKSRINRKNMDLYNKVQSEYAEYRQSLPRSVSRLLSWDLVDYNVAYDGTRSINQVTRKYKVEERMMKEQPSKQLSVKLTDKGREALSGAIPSFQLGKSGITLTPKGFVYKGEVYLNQDEMSLDTPIHEFGHLWNAWAKENRKDVFKKGTDLIKGKAGKAYVDKVKKTQPHLKGDAIYEEALAEAIGDRGAQIVNKAQHSKFMEWLNALWESIRKGLRMSNLTASQVSELNLEQFTEAVANDLLSGEEMTNPDVVDLNEGVQENGLEIIKAPIPKRFAKQGYDHSNSVAYYEINPDQQTVSLLWKRPLDKDVEVVSTRVYGEAQNGAFKSTPEQDKQFKNRLKRIQKTRENLDAQFDQTREFQPISEGKFKQLIKRLQQAFPNTKVVTNKEAFEAKVDKVTDSEIKNSEGEVYGFVDKDGTIYINPEKLNANTPIHEFGHVWLNALEKNNKVLFNQGIALVRGKDGKKYMDHVNSNPKYKNLSSKQKAKEALVTAIGDRGEAFLTIESKSKFWTFLRKIKDFLKRTFFKDRQDRVDALSFEQFVDAAVGDLLGGSDLGIDGRSDNVEFDYRGDEQVPQGDPEESNERRLLESVRKRLKDLKSQYKARKTNYKTRKATMHKVKNDLVNKVSDYLNADVIAGLSQKEIKRLMSAVANANTEKQFEEALDKFSDIALEAKFRNYVKKQRRFIKSVEQRMSERDIEARQKRITRDLLNTAKEFLSQEGVKNNLSMTEIIRIGRTISDAKTEKAAQKALDDFKKILKKAKAMHAKEQMRRQEQKDRAEAFRAAKKALQKEVQDFSKMFFGSWLNPNNVQYITRQEVKRIHNRLKNAKTEKSLKKAINDLTDVIYNLETRKVTSSVANLLKKKLSKLESGRRKPVINEVNAKVINGVKSVLNNFAVNRKAAKKTETSSKAEDRARLDQEFLADLQERIAELQTKAQESGLKQIEDIELASSKIASDIIQAKVTKNKKDKYESMLAAYEALEETYSEGKALYSEWMEQRREALENRKDELKDAANGYEKRTTRLPNEIAKDKAGIRRWMVATAYNSLLGEGMGDMQTLFRTIDKQRNTHIHSGAWMDFFRDILRSSTNKTYGVMQKGREIKEIQSEIFGEKRKYLRDTQLNMTLVLGKQHQIEKEAVIDKDGKEIREAATETYSESELLNLWMHYKNKELIPTFNNAGFTPEVMAKVDKLLDPRSKEYGEALFAFYDDYYSEVNQTYKELYGYSLGRPEHYAGKLHRVFAGDEQDLIDAFGMVRTAAGGSTKERITANTPIIAVDVNASVAQYISEMEHFKAFAQTHRIYDALTKDPEFKAILMQNNKNLNYTKRDGVAGNKLLDNLNMYLHTQIARSQIDDGTNKFMQVLMSNVVRSTLAVKPKIFANQLLSSTNAIPFLAEGKHATAGYNPRTYLKDAKYLFNNSSYIRNRWNSDDISQLTTGLTNVTAANFDFHSTSGKKSRMGNVAKAIGVESYREFKKMMGYLMYNVKLGDMGGIMGSVPVYSSWKSQLLAEGKSEQEAEAEAMRRFEAAVELAQQAQTNFGKSRLQLTAIGKLFTMYVTSPIQNYRNSMNSFMELRRGITAAIDKAHGKKPKKEMKGSYARHALSVLNFWFFQPMMYQYLTNRLAGGLGWLIDLISGDEPEEKPDENDKSMLTALLLSNFATLPFAGSFLTFMLETVAYGEIEEIGAKDHTFGGILPNPVQDEGSRMKQDLERYSSAKTTEKKREYFWKAAGHAADLLTPLPEDTFVEYYGLTKAEFFGEDGWFEGTGETEGVNWSKYSPEDKFWMWFGHTKGSMEYEVKDREPKKRKGVIKLKLR